MGCYWAKKQANSSTKHIQGEKHAFIAERFIEGLVKIHGKCPVSTDGTMWYPQAYRFLNLKHHIHPPLVKSLIERAMQYIKDRTESFDGYFPYRRKNCKLKHVKNWLRFFVDYHNNELNAKVNRVDLIHQ